MYVFVRMGPVLYYYVTVALLLMNQHVNSTLMLLLVEVELILNALCT